MNTRTSDPSSIGTATLTPGIRVPMISESDAGGATAELFEEIRTRLGLPFVPDMFRLTSTRPDLLHVVLTGFSGLFEGGELARGDKEIIAAWTSKLNSCTYCVGTHNWFLLQFGGSQELTDAIMNSASAEELPLDVRYQPLLRLVTQTTQAAYKVTERDWAAAEAAGWTRAQLLEAVFCASLFNFINRLVDATGLGLTIQSVISQQPTEPGA